MLKAVLFDLDNTLIFYDEIKFADLFFPPMAARFADVLPSDKFAVQLMVATIEAHKNDGSVINRELFLREFTRGTTLTGEDAWNRFLKYYDEDFDSMKETVTTPGSTRQVFQCIRKLDLKLVIATDPVLPLSAQRTRLSWADVDGIELDLVTHIGNMSFCKPQLGYYRQICEFINEKPEDCLMVGDDFANDMVAAKIGMKTYKAVDSLDHTDKPLELSKQVIGNNTDGIPPADFEGPLACVPEAVDKLLK
jgi:FMN phosphatase YigB (HAD superfamily)